MKNAHWLNELPLASNKKMEARTSQARTYPEEKKLKNL